MRICLLLIFTLLVFVIINTIYDLFFHYSIILLIQIITVACNAERGDLERKREREGWIKRRRRRKRRGEGEENNPKACLCNVTVLFVNVMLYVLTL